ncbi:Holliday junction resolvase [Enterobacter phage Arya]|uniref:Putative VRR-NUC domain-containing protein n=1 Tax=Enterobacter phage Arya TaxID=1864622 RepID=A0A193GYR3_9CAUD|nr:Holliday junction resolvase [Enterobacter phage Arya]ANN86156.1 putative VRR-NUC domain-containing protein [Enterobacter phage Arya]
MANKEHALQNTIRNALAGRALIFRANVGKAYASNDVVKVPRQMPVVMGPRDVLLKNARPFETGLPPGFADLFGLVAVEITPDMVGKKLAVFTALEVKDGARVSPLQRNFINAVNDNGGRAGVVRSVDDAEHLVFGK